MPEPFILPFGLQPRVEALAAAFLQPPGTSAIDFAAPPGEPGLAAPDSVSWQVFRNPVALFTGGVAAVLLELAEPRVRTGVWEHSSFQADPVARLQRTGLAAMVTVYAARSVAEPMIAGIRRTHDTVAGTTPAGEPYRASDPELLTWVQATAAFGFLEAYCRYVSPLPLVERDRFYEEGAPAAELYGVVGVPRSTADMNALFRRMRPRLEPSPIVTDFLDLLRRAPLLPAAFIPVQDLLLRAAVATVPPWVRSTLQIGERWDLGPLETKLVKAAASVAQRYRIDSSPPAQACLRMGLPVDHLHRSAASA